MFTGLVSAVGRIKRVAADRGGLDLDVEAPYRGIRLGESIAVDGACLTVARRFRGGFGVRVITTSLDRTLFGERTAGDRVNLERALAAGDRLGGHLVQGHVDGIATVKSVVRRKDAVVIDLAVPAAVAKISVPLGSITVQGVSLTINGVGPGRIVQISLIPHTLAVTTLGTLERGDRVHVEGDVIGKYLEALTRGRRRRAKRASQ